MVATHEERAFARRLRSEGRVGRVICFGLGHSSSVVEAIETGQRLLKAGPTISRNSGSER